MINQGFFRQPQSIAARWPQTSKKHQICKSLKFQMKIPFSIALNGCKISLKDLETGRGGQFVPIIKIWGKNDKPYWAKGTSQEILYLIANI